jgi:cytochrome c-type biogenesis protein CcmF
MIPIGLVLLLLTGIGPLLAWRKSTLANLRDQFLVPGVFAVLIGGTVVALGVRLWSSGLCFAFSGLVLGTVAQEFWRGARVRQQTSGTDLFTALVGLVGRNKRRYGGYLVHVGIVLMFLGFAGEGFKLKETVEASPGQNISIGDFTVRFDGLKVTDDGRKQMVTGETTVLRNGAELLKMYPARWFFRKHEDQPTTEVAIRRSFSEDLYIALLDFNLSDQRASIEIYVNPLINWLWFGFGMLAFGTFIALLPDRAFAFADARVPAHAATASLILLAVVLWPASILAQEAPHAKFTALEERLRSEIMCTCGCRRSMTFCGMPNCHGEAEQMTRLREYISQGKSHDAVLAAFVSDMGAEMLMSPPDSGFNRLAWLLPYVLGTAGLVTIVLTARRWSHSTAAVAGGADVTLDPALDARLDDELRDLD